MSTRRSAEGARGVVFAGALIAVGCALALVESALVPALPVPGVRLGLANLAVVLALAWMGPRPALVVGAGRVVATWLLAASLGGPAFLMAMAGSLAAWTAMSVVAARWHSLSPVGWSAAGSFAHVAAQIAIAAWLTGTVAVVSLAPVSLLLGLASGCLVGLVAQSVISRSPVLASVGDGKGTPTGAIPWPGGHSAVARGAQEGS